MRRREGGKVGEEGRLTTTRTRAHNIRRLRKRCHEIRVLLFLHVAAISCIPTVSGTLFQHPGSPDGPHPARFWDWGKQPATRRNRHRRMIGMFELMIHRCRSWSVIVAVAGRLRCRDWSTLKTSMLRHLRVTDHRLERKYTGIHYARRASITLHGFGID